MAHETKKNFVLQKVEYLLDLIQEAYEQDDEIQKTQLFPPNYLEVQEIREHLIANNKVSKESLVKLNYYYREITAIKEAIDGGNSMTYIEWIDWKTKDILENTDEQTPIQTAIYYILKNTVKSDGNLYELPEAIKFVEQIRAKYSIKKR